MTTTQHDHDNTAEGTAGKPKRKPLTDAQKATKNARSAARRADPAHRAKEQAYRNDPATKAKRKAREADPAHKAKEQAYRAARYATVKDDPDYIAANRAKSAQWAKDNLEANRARASQWAKDNPDAMKARLAKWYAVGCFGHEVPPEFDGPGVYAQHLGYRSGFEALIARQLEEAGVKFEYELLIIDYINSAGKPATYCPDFVLGNGTLIEAKGYWRAKDFEKMRLVKKQRPHLDIRMVFQQSPERTIEPRTGVSNADLCDSLGIPFAHKTIPPEWTVNTFALSYAAE